MALRRPAADAPPAVGGGFVVAFLDIDDAERQMPLAAAVGTAFEDARPVRSFPSYQGQRNYPGLWWSATDARHVGYESWLERDCAMLLDHDPGVVGFASQPFWLHWREGRRVRSHAPDWFARLADGTAVVIDCRPQERVRAIDAAAFAATERACAEVGWRYQLVSDHDPTLIGNVRWLAGYRHPRHHQADLAAELVAAFSQPRPLLTTATAIGDPIRVLPVGYHLLWVGTLTTDLAVPLHPDSLVGPRGAKS